MSQAWLAEMYMGVYAACHDMLAFEFDSFYAFISPCCAEYLVIETFVIHIDDFGDLSFRYDDASDRFLFRSYDCCLVQKICAHYFLGLIFLIFSPMTPQNASPKIPLLIFEVPSVLSTNMIGTSLILNPSL